LPLPAFSLADARIEEYVSCFLKNSLPAAQHSHHHIRDSQDIDRLSVAPFDIILASSLTHAKHISMGRHLIANNNIQYLIDISNFIHLF
jgi:hypothetical protein